MVYVHSKLLVADDAVAIVGSANVNDRSLLGDRDTEVCLVVEDRAAVRDLRLKLLRAHLGMEPLPGHGTPHVDHFDRPHHRKWDDDLDDLDSPRVWQTILDVVALNTQLLEAAFDDVPWDDVATLADAKAALGLSAVSRHARICSSTLGLGAERTALS
ncbi:phospholipase D [Aureococcus anophagefferens]|uniref:phospholipase D n=1 Tax=Aureococcus anophagefferens TaxID=44056 RepID=A0ABR1FVN3_AURAN